jgi:DNA-binding response OmpR family regulator
MATRSRARTFLGMPTASSVPAEVPSRPRLGRTRPVLLAVLDDSERSALLKLSLAARGWDVVRAHSCEEARSRMNERHMDALLTDLVLPDGSAFGLIRSLPSRPRVAVVLTWGNQHGIRERIAASGFDLHLVRPINAEEIDRAMRERLP